MREFALYPRPEDRYAADVRIALDQLPNDPAQLHELVRDLAAALENRDAAIVSKDVALAEGVAEVERLRLIIRQLERARFGRRSEQLDPDQMAFGLEELEADLARAEGRMEPTGDPSHRPNPSTPPHRAPLPAHLPRLETVIAAPHDTCPDCGGDLHDAGSTSSEMLDWVPAQLRVIRITRPKRACRCCGTLHQAPAPERPLAGGTATPGLLAHVLVSRYCDHLPLYRQSRIFARHGLEISRSTLSGLGWRRVLVVGGPARSRGRPRHGGRSRLRRRHATAGSRTRPRPDKDRAALGLHAR